MTVFFILILFIIALLFGFSSMSQSAASAQQAQAAIEASRAAQIASVGNLIAVIVMTLVVVSILAAVAFTFWLMLSGRSRAGVQTAPGQNAHWQQVQQPDVNGLLPTVLTMLMYQMLQDRSYREAEQLFQLGQDHLDNEISEDHQAFLDTPWTV